MSKIATIKRLKSQDDLSLFIAPIEKIVRQFMI